MAKLLLVEDDRLMIETVRKWLEFEHHHVEVVDNGVAASEHLRFYKYDLVILDWRLPGRTGPDVLKEFRAEGGITPVLMLTGKDAVQDNVTGLDAGADDYLTKPFEIKELSARVRALLRRAQEPGEEPVVSGSLTVDKARCVATRNGVDLKLTPSEIALLDFLMRHSREVFGPEAILRRLSDVFVADSINAVRTQVKKLRRKIDLEGRESHILSVHGVGYRFNDSVER